MKLKLKENPREWSKFTTVMAFIAVVLIAVLWRREVLGRELFWGLAGLLAGVTLLAWLRPGPFRGFYRVGMRFSFHVGQVMGAVMLTVFFLVVMTPLGLLLRLCGKDLLGLKRRDAGSYWRESRTSDDFDRQF